MPNDADYPAMRTILYAGLLCHPQPSMLDQLKSSNAYIFNYFLSFVEPFYFYRVNKYFTAYAVTHYQIPAVALDRQRSFHPFTDEEIASFTLDQLETLQLHLLMTFLYLPTRPLYLARFDQQDPYFRIELESLLDSAMTSADGDFRLRVQDIHLLFLQPIHLCFFIRLRLTNIIGESRRASLKWVEADPSRALCQVQCYHSHPHHHKRNLEDEMNNGWEDLEELPAYKEWLRRWPKVHSDSDFLTAQQHREHLYELACIMKRHGYKDLACLSHVRDPRVPVLENGVHSLCPALRRRMAILPQNASKIYNLGAVEASPSTCFLPFWETVCCRAFPFIHPYSAVCSGDLVQDWPDRNGTEFNYTLHLWNETNPGLKFCCCLTFWLKILNLSLRTKTKSENVSRSPSGSSQHRKPEDS